MISWAYGVTTVPQRRYSLLPRTLASLAAAGFTRPRLFVDGFSCLPDYYAEQSAGLQGPAELKVPITQHEPAAGAYGNWVLALLELYLTNPKASRYTIFQDDLVAYKHLREYLEQQPFPGRGYWNLYTFPKNQALAPSKVYEGWYMSDQRGRGALALCFDRQGVFDLLRGSCMLDQPLRLGEKGWSSIDGSVSNSLVPMGYVEYVHRPTLVMHTGYGQSTLCTRQHLLAQDFRGEDYNALDLLEVAAKTQMPG